MLFENVKEKKKLFLLDSFVTRKYFILHFVGAATTIQLREFGAAVC